MQPFSHLMRHPFMLATQIYRQLLLLVFICVSHQVLADQTTSREVIALESVTIAADEYSAGFSHELLGQVLSRHIVKLEFTTAVDYQGLAANADDLIAYLDSLARVELADFDRWPTAEQLAFLINAYNAWTLKLIIDNYPEVNSIRDLGSFFSSPWQKEFIPLLGETRSLDNIEHTLIRASDRYQDARIHFAVNCASIGCPALRAEVYTGEQLELQLEQQTIQFLSDKSRNYAEGDELFLSQIFNWYENDFERGWNGSQALSQFLLKYRKALSLSADQIALLQDDKMDFEYLSYDWSLNEVLPK